MNAITSISNRCSSGNLPADHRTALLIARDHGQELMASASSRDAIALGWWIHREADIALETPSLSPALVERALKCCRHLALAALEIERLEARRD
jgi:hypothetical protein